MTVITGKLSAMLPGGANWVDYGPGKSFTVQPNQKFKVKADSDTAYLCLYK